MMGLSKSKSPNPTARSIARFGARSTPRVIALLLLFKLMEIVGGRQSIGRFLQRSHSRGLNWMQPVLVFLASARGHCAKGFLNSLRHLSRYGWADSFPFQFLDRYNFHGCAGKKCFVSRE